MDRIFTNLLPMIGGLCLFLFGMTIMGQALERRAGSKLRDVLGKLTSNKAAGLMTGMGVTAVIQSSSATTVMVVGFVNSGLMRLKQAIYVIMGANIGTTITAWILSLGGISDGNLVMKMLKPTSFTPVLALIGTVLYMFCKSNKKKDTGAILLGFATLMFGMETMTNAVEFLADVPAFQELFLLFQNPILGVLAGAVLTAIIQSSSASVGILQALAATGRVTYGAAIPIIMGQNIGTCITAMLSSVGANKNAKRAAAVHLSFNVIGTAVWLIVFSLVQWLVKPALFGEGASLAGIAVAHSIFNIACTLLMLPLTGFLEKLVSRLIPDGKKPEADSELDERLLATPSIALERCRSLTVLMGQGAVGALKDSLDMLGKFDGQKAESIRESEEQTDHYEDILGTYLVRLSNHEVSAQDRAEAAKMLKIIGDFERISDHAVNILESAEEMREKDMHFTPRAAKEMEIASNAVKEVLTLTLHAFEYGDLSAARKVEALEEVVDHLKETLRTCHIARLQKGSCSIEVGFIWADLLTNIERTSDHCSNIAGSVIEMARDNMNFHDLSRGFRKEDPTFQTDFQMYLEKYAVHAGDGALAEVPME